jgi:hypothetical protein
MIRAGGKLCQGESVRTPASCASIAGPSREQRPVRRSAPSPDEYVERLRDRVMAHLDEQGFKLTGAGLLAPVPRSKDELRRLHEHAVEERRASARASLVRHEDAFLRQLTRPDRLDVARIRPRLVLVDDRRSFHGLPVRAAACPKPANIGKWSVAQRQNSLTSGFGWFAGC